MGVISVVFFAWISCAVISVCYSQLPNQVFRIQPQMPTADYRFHPYPFPVYGIPLVEPSSPHNYQAVEQMPKNDMHRIHQHTRTVENCKDNVAVTINMATREYKYINGQGWYKVYPALVSFNQAKSICASDGAQMVVLQSQTESALTVSLLTAAGVTRGWVGLTDAEVEGTFKTIFGDAISTTFAPWPAIAPANDATKNCVYMNTATSTISISTCNAAADLSATVCEM